MLRKKLCCFAMILLTICLSGCGIRTRVIVAPGAEGTVTENSEKISAFEDQKSNSQNEDMIDSIRSERKEDLQSQEEPDLRAQTRNDPQAERREYDPDASAEINSFADQTLWNDNETGDDSGSSEDLTGKQATVTEMADLTATELLAQEEAEKLGVSDEAPQADTTYRYYLAMLESRVSTLFECKRLYLYWETSQKGQTIYKTSPEHEVIRLSGCYDVAVKRQEDALFVDDGWIERKNPDGIIKCVSANVLGEGIQTDRFAQNVWEQLAQRTALAGTNAMRHGRVLLVSAQLMDSPAGRLGAAIFIAEELYPDLFADVEPTQALQQLLYEERGMAPEGYYFYGGLEEHQ